MLAYRSHNILVKDEKASCTIWKASEAQRLSILHAQENWRHFRALQSRKACYRSYSR